MATYAIGDIQGCHYAFQALLAKLNFDEHKDQLWLLGDIINRGSGSLAVLKWCYQHRACVRMVLGNHDLHTLVVAHGAQRARKRDTLQAILDAPDAKTLLTWLRHQPLMLSNGDYTMVHAGLLPQWQLNEALAYAKEVEQALQSADYGDFLSQMYGNEPRTWHNDLVEFDRLRVITNVMTRMRICTKQGEMEFTFKGELNDVPVGYMPWFDVPDRQTQSNNIIFGHWSALGLHQRANVFGLDTGCLWGGHLTAMCLEDRAITQVEADKKDQPLKV